MQLDVDAIMRQFSGGVTAKDMQDKIQSDRMEYAKQVAQVANEIFRLAKQYTPVASGNLKNSAVLKISGTQATITYNAPYAVYVHEITTNAHKKGTYSKFLETAAVEAGLGQEVTITINYNPLELYINQPGRGSPISIASTGNAFLDV